MLSLSLDSYASTSAVTLEALAALAMHVASDQTKIVFGVGAGISTAAGIPDFRGSCGSLYSDSSLRYPTTTHSTLPDTRLKPARSARRTKQLFHYDALLRPESRAEHFALMVELRKAAKRARRKGKEREDPRRVESGTKEAPTAFHGLMKDLHERGRLARVYTQNVDGLEAAAGLLDSFPAYKEYGTRRPATSGFGLVTSTRNGPNVSKAATPTSPRHPSLFPPRSKVAEASVVTLHGSLDQVTCSVCHYTTKWKKRHTVAFQKGRARKCPICYGRAQSRVLESKRAIRPPHLAFLRPAIVLYDDPAFASSSAAAQMSSLAAADLAAGPTCLIVAGTSLRIPGFRTLVKDFSRAVRKQGGFCVLVNNDPVGKGWNPFFDYHFLGDTEVFARHFSNLLEAFLPLPHLPSSSLTRIVSSTLGETITLEPVSKMSLPPTPPPSSSPLLPHLSDLPAAELPRPHKRPVTTSVPCYPGRKRQRRDPLFEKALSPAPTAVADGVNKEDDLLVVADSDHERAARAYLSPPPSSLPEQVKLMNQPIPPHSHATEIATQATPALAPSPPDAKRQRSSSSIERRLEHLGVAEILRRAEKHERQLRREAERAKQARKEEKHRRREERRQRGAAEIRLE
ncbi:hypothetical protein JCM10908_006057 [Rhodotorula pacifica]|uniref:uncharacterized protein n=1 Tax=Rhodotorula pacifica TaxID=1495444 RepID=UPI003173F2D8